MQIYGIFLLISISILICSTLAIVKYNINIPYAGPYTAFRTPKAAALDGLSTVCAVLQHCPSSNLAMLRRKSDQMTCIDFHPVAPTLLNLKRTCRTADRRDGRTNLITTCSVSQILHKFESFPVPFCGANSSGHWVTSSSGASDLGGLGGNPWSNQSIVIDVKTGGYPQPVEMIMAWTPTDADGSCRKALSQSLCDPVHDTKLLHISLNFTFPSRPAQIEDILRVKDEEKLLDHVGDRLAFDLGMNLPRPLPLIHYSYRVKSFIRAAYLVPSSISNLQILREIIPDHYSIDIAGFSSSAEVQIKVLKVSDAILPDSNKKPDLKEKKNGGGRSFLEYYGKIIGMVAGGALLTALIVVGTAAYLKHRRFGYSGVNF